MKKIKILYIIDYLSTGGGTENQLRELISNLDRERFDPTLITLSRLQNWLGMPEYHDPGCPHICLELPKIGHPKTVGGILRLARLIRREKFDIVQTFFVDANIIGVLSGFLGGCGKIIVSRRDMGYWHTPKLLFLLRQINRLADYYMVNSKAVKSIVIEREKIPNERIKVINNGIFDIPDDDPSPLRKTDFGIPEDSHLLGIVANLRKVKRIDNFIRIAAKVERMGTHFMVVGIGFLKDELLDQARKTGLGARFHIVHTLDSIYDYIKLFDVGVLTSDSEGLSNTLIEYQLCKIPSVAFDVGGNREVIDHEQTGYLIKHGDLDGMRLKIDLLLNNTDLRQKLGNEGKKRTSIRFAGKRMIKESGEFYERIIEKRQDYDS